MLIVGLALQACKREEPETTVRVAVGAVEVLELDASRCYAGEPQQACISHEIDSLGELLEVEIEGKAFVLHGEAVLDGWVLGIPVEAVSVGQATLVVRTLDHDKEEVDRIGLSAHEITHVEAAIPCDSREVGSRYAISTGSAFQFDLSAFDGEVPLASGDLELVDDYDGVTVLSPPDHPWFRDAVAPDEAGPRSWSPIGHSDPVEFLFYDGADLGASLVALDPRFEDDDFEVTQSVDGEPVCVHEGPALATVAVTSGDCRIGFDGFAFEGPMPIDLGRGPVALSLLGTDTCEVTATTDNNEATVEVSVVDEVPPEVSGTPIPADPIPSEADLPPREECPEIRAPTDGSCELIVIPGVIVLPSQDCLFSSRWTFQHNDEHGDPLGSATLGVGLTTELLVGVEYELFGFIGWSDVPAANLVLSTSSADIDDLGCLDEELQAVALTVYEPGTVDLRFEASNIGDPGFFGVSAVEAARAEFSVGGEAPLGDGAVAEYFVGSTVPVAIAHFDVHGEQLAGIGPFEVGTSDIRDAVLSGDEIHVGSTSGELRLSSPNAPTAARIHTVDVSSVTEVVAPAGATPVGEIACFTPTALAPNGAEIHGQSASPIGIALTGEALVVSKREDGDGAINTVCFEGFVAGTTSVDVTWGTATARAEWLVP